MRKDNHYIIKAGHKDSLVKWTVELLTRTEARDFQLVYYHVGLTVLVFSQVLARETDQQLQILQLLASQPFEHCCRTWKTGCTRPTQYPIQLKREVLKSSPKIKKKNQKSSYPNKTTNEVSGGGHMSQRYPVVNTQVSGQHKLQNNNCTPATQPIKPNHTSFNLFQ